MNLPVPSKSQNRKASLPKFTICWLVTRTQTDGIIVLASGSQERFTSQELRALQVEEINIGCLLISSCLEALSSSEHGTLDGEGKRNSPVNILHVFYRGN